MNKAHQKQTYVLSEPEKQQMQKQIFLDKDTLAQPKVPQHVINNFSGKHSNERL